MDRPGVRQVPKSSGEQGEMEKTGCKIICGVPTTLAIKGLMMMMMMMMMIMMCVYVSVYVCVYVCVSVCVGGCGCVCARARARVCNVTIKKR